ncbi:MAG TPA: alpha/beta hydrolase-fold protein [Flavisolibacter sp.]|jgi:hypothetical protein|nr:alpha/beta hydrolase-fold protein [Flavisolibacter sp.]
MRTIFLFAGLLLGIVSFAQKKKVKDTAATSRPFVLGTIETLHSNILGEDRTLNIYLPEGYNKTDSARYPVIYLLDGSADEDFIHVVGLVQFNTFPWIERIPKTIVVGIANTKRRYNFTFPTTVEKDRLQWPDQGGSSAFIDFLEKELQPYVNAHFNTNASRTIIGQSLGGLLATEILFRKPQLFDKYIIVSPSLWWDNGSLLKATPVITSETVLPPTGIYIGMEQAGLTPGETPHAMEVDVHLLVEKLRLLKNKNLTIAFDYLPEETHATIGHQAVFNAFRMLYPQKAAQ